MNKELIMEAIKAIERVEKERAILIEGIKELEITLANLDNPKINKMLEIVRKYENLQKNTKYI